MLIPDWHIILEPMVTRDVTNVTEISTLTNWGPGQDLSQDARESEQLPRVVEKRERGTFIKKYSDLRLWDQWSNEWDMKKKELDEAIQKTAEEIREKFPGRPSAMGRDAQLRKRLEEMRYQEKHFEEWKREDQIRKEKMGRFQ
jgi:hypothetical protein